MSALPQHKQPKILLFDIETAPIKGYAWTVHETDLLHIERNTYILSFAYKWLDKPKVHVRALPDYPLFKRDIHNDRALMEGLWKLLDEADIVIAHNLAFDLPKAMARFAYHGLKPPSWCEEFCTLKMARRCFRMDSNRLSDLAQYLGIGRKLPHTGMDLWMKCTESGDAKAWATMRRYNAHDVYLLEQVYLRLRVFDKRHPDLNKYTRRGDCPTCQSKDIQRRGRIVSKTGYKHRFQCMGCGNWFSGLEHIRERAPAYGQKVQNA